MPIYETRKIGTEYKIVNFNEAMEKYFQPLRQNMSDNINKIQETAKAQAEEFKKYFIGELQKLDSAMHQKIKMLERKSKPTPPKNNGSKISVANSMRF